MLRVGLKKAMSAMKADESEEGHQLVGQFAMTQAS